MLEVVGRDIISGNMGFIGTDPGREYQMGAAEKTEDITVTGNPAVLDNATGKPFKDLHIYGRSEQMTTTGAQLFDASSIKKNDKIQVEISDNSYTIQMTTTINESGSPSNRVYIAINHVIEGDFSGKTVTLSYDGVNSDVPNERYVIGLMYNTDDGRTHYLSLQKDMPKSISVTLPENTTNLTLRLFITEFTSPTVPAGTYTVTIQGAMLTEGSEKKDWEPYTGGKPSPSPDYPQEIQSAGDDGNLSVIVKNPDNEQIQSVSFSTPNGLPGIPVTSGGNYTDENGQQWICDEVDLGRGVYVQRIASFVINAKNANDISVTNLYTHVTVAVNARIRTPEKTIASSATVSTRNLFCEALPWIADAWSSTVNSMGFVEDGMIDFTIENSYLGLNAASTNDERKAALVKYFTDKPCQIVYRIATPIETPLNAAEIAAYKSLRTYRDTTIVEAEDKAGISVTFKRNVKTGNVSAEKKIEESKKKEYDES